MRLITSIFSVALAVFLPTISSAIVCGEVPVYCVMEIDQTGDHKATYYETMPLLASCLQTEYTFPNAAPICKVKEFDKEAIFEKCKQLYPSGPYERVVAITYYKGGDPVSIFSTTNPHLWGDRFYKVTDVILDTKHQNISGQPFPGCDVVGDAF